MQWLSACCRVSKVIFLSTLVACDPTLLFHGLLFLMLSLSTFLNYFSKHQKTSAKRQGTFILVAGLRKTAGVAPPWKQDREAEQQQPTTCTGSNRAAAYPTHTGSNALQSSNRRLRVARVGASVYVVVQRCCRIKPLQRAGKAPGALPLSVPVCASLLL